MLTEEELELIHWRATRGTHYGGAIICTSLYGIQVIEEDIPRLLMEIKQLQKQVAQLEADVERLRPKWEGIPE